MEQKIQMFANRLTKVYRHLSKRAKKEGVSCYRVYDHDLPEFPVCIELYENYVYVAEYKRHHQLTEAAHEQWLTEVKNVIATVLNVVPENIYVRVRQRKQGRQGQYQRMEQQQTEIVVKEQELNFLVNLSDYLDTGLFLDHRLTRLQFSKMAAGKRVLNLFAYTGAFSVHAAAANASTVTTVDLSNTYLNWAQRNFLLNNFTDANRYRFDRADVLQYMKEVPSESYDLIIMDPPTFSNSKKMQGILDIQAEHPFLINQCLRVLTPGGILFFSTNYTRFVLEKEQLQSSKIKDITKATTPFDFEGKLKRYCFLIEK